MYEQGLESHGISNLMLYLAVHTGLRRPHLEPGHVIRVEIVSCSPRQIGPCVVLGSGAWQEYGATAGHDSLQ